MTLTRKEAIQILSTRDAHGVLCGYTSGVTEALDMAIEALQMDIVYCKDCKRCESDGGALMTCEVTEMIVDDDYYCWWGERREP